MPGWILIVPWIIYCIFQLYLYQNKTATYTNQEQNNYLINFQTECLNYMNITVANESIMELKKLWIEGYGGNLEVFTTF